QSRAAGGKAVSLEFTMGQRRVSRGEDRGRNLGGDAGPGRSAPVSWPGGQIQPRNGIAARDTFGRSTDSADAAQATGIPAGPARKPPSSEFATGASAAAGAPDHASGDLPTVKLGDVCPACGEVDVRTLFSATDRLYGTTD